MSTVGSQMGQFIERKRTEEALAEERNLLRTLIDAIMTVRRDIPKEELPQNINAVRRVLQSMSLSDLRRVQSILPAVERRRRAEGVE